MIEKSNFYIFSAGDTKYIFSGFTGLLLVYNKRIEEFLNDPNSDDNELKEHLIGTSSASEKSYYHEKPYLKTITVFTTNQCNLSCSYCYGKINNLDEAKRMDLKVFKDGIEYFLKNFDYGDYVNIFYFGGEPLLNFPLIKDSVDLLGKLEKLYNVVFSYSITSNGTILNKEIKDFLTNNNFKIMISIDGDRLTHDSQRKFLNGKGSFAIIIQNIHELSKYTEIFARTTLLNLDTDLIQLYETLLPHGVKEFDLELASEKNGYLERKKDLQKLSNRLHLFANYFIEQLKDKQLVRLRNLIRILSSIHYGCKKTPKDYPCGAGNSTYALAVNGDIYLCHRFNNISEYRWGNIYQGFQVEKRQEFLNRHIMSLRDSSRCANCWARYLCGGTCYNTSYFADNQTERISENHCFFNKEIIKNALYIYASIPEKERIIFDNIRSEYRQD